jgi:hypothetical protein
VRRGVGNYAALLGDFWRNPNTRALTHEARALYCDALSYAADNLTDGIVPKSMLQGMHGELPIVIPVVLLTALREDGGSFFIDRGSSIEIVGYLDVNPSKAELRAKSEKSKKAVQSRWDKAPPPERSDTERNTSGITERTTPPEPRTQNPELLTQNIYTRAREEPKQATPAQVDRAVASAMASVRPPPPERTTFGEVEHAFAAMRLRRTGKQWRRPTSAYAACQDAAEWAETCAATEGRPVAAIIAESIAGFEADGWAGGVGWPFGPWASDPGKFCASKASAPPPSPRTRADLIREIEEHNARQPRQGT